MSDGRGEGFLARWSRRKEAGPEARAREDERVREEAGLPAPPAAAEPEVPPPDLPPVETLTPASDFTRFMRSDVPQASRNAAMKKLFADPHFNLMDGLDTYIDDYTRADPIPLAMLKELAQSRMLGLFDEDEAADTPGADDSAAAAAPVGGDMPAAPGPADPAVLEPPVGPGPNAGLSADVGTSPEPVATINTAPAGPA